MSLMMMLGMFVKVSLCMLTVSNALLMCKAATTMSCGGLELLKPVVIWWQMLLCKAVCAECFMFESMLMGNGWNVFCYVW